MEIRLVLKSQYHAALKTLRLAVEACPVEMWADGEGRCAPFWQVAYHTLFFTHFYLGQDRAKLVPWEKHRRGVETLDNPAARAAEPYTREDVLAYWSMVDGMIDAGVDRLDLETQQCGFPWYKMGTLEHQLANIRHVQHHAAALATRLRMQAGIEVEWVKGGKE